MPISHIPQRSLHQDPGQLARRCAEHLIAVEPSKPILEAGYQTGERIWGPLIDGKEGHAAAVDSDQDFAALS